MRASYQSSASGRITRSLIADEYQEFSTRLDEDDMVLSYSNTLTESRKSNGSIDIKVVDGSVMINNAKVLKADVNCKNGVIHVIDTVILPK